VPRYQLVRTRRCTCTKPGPVVAFLGRGIGQKPRQKIPRWVLSPRC
jgi:hypothetical protein